MLVVCPSTVSFNFALSMREREQDTGHCRKSAKVLRHMLRALKMVIVDEVSMISELNLAYLHLHLCELFGGDEWFVSVNVLLAGDLLQLPPVFGGPGFDRLNNKMVLSKPGCMASANIYLEGDRGVQ